MNFSSLVFYVALLGFVSLGWLQSSGVNGASVSLTVDVESSDTLDLLGAFCPRTTKIVCTGVGLTVLRWRYNTVNDIYTFSTTDSPTIESLSGHPGLIEASLDEVTPLPSDMRFANFTSTLTVDLEQLQGVVNIVCGDPGTTDSILVNVTVIQPPIPSTPRIVSVTAIYQATVLGSIEVSWGKLEALCSQSLMYQLSIESTPQNISQASCGQRLCTAVVNTTGRELTEISLRAVNEVGTSGTDTYPMIEQMSGQYYTPQVNITDNCVATAQCVPGPSLSGSTTCFVQYTLDPTYTNLSDPVTGQLNTIFEVLTIQPNVSYYFVFSVMLDDSLTVKAYMEEKNPECGIYTPTVTSPTTPSDTGAITAAVTVPLLIVLLLVVVVVIFVAWKAWSRNNEEYDVEQNSDQAITNEVELMQVIGCRHVSTQTYTTGELKSVGESVKDAVKTVKGKIKGKRYTKRPTYVKEDNLVEHWPAKPEIYHVPVGQIEVSFLSKSVSSSTQTEKHDKRFTRGCLWPKTTLTSMSVDVTDEEQQSVEVGIVGSDTTQSSEQDNSSTTMVFFETIFDDHEQEPEPSEQASEPEQQAIDQTKPAQASSEEADGLSEKKNKNAVFRKIKKLVPGKPKQDKNEQDSAPTDQDTVTASADITEEPTLHQKLVKKNDEMYGKWR